MLNVSELITDPDFCGSFTVTRKTGQWSGGDFSVAQSQTLTMTGVVTPMNTKDILQLPQGDTIKGAINIYSHEPVYTTEIDTSSPGDSGNFSDEVTWQGDVYKIIQTSNFSDYGYFYALGTRKLGA